MQLPTERCHKIARSGDNGAVRMVSPDGRWRVDQIRVERGGRTSTRLRVSSFGTFVAEVSELDELAALGVPLAELVDVDDVEGGGATTGRPWRSTRS